MKKQETTFEDKRKEFFNKEKNQFKADQLAREWLVCSLKELIAHIESNRYPIVFSASIPKDGIETKEVIIDYQISLSRPWGG